MAKTCVSLQRLHPEVYYPPFCEFATLIQELSLERNNPLLAIQTPERRSPQTSLWSGEKIRVKKTDVKAADDGPLHILKPANWCVVHCKPHPLSKCRAFHAKTIEEKFKTQKQNRICFCCIASCEHLVKDCKADVTCTECKSDRHLVVLHVQREKNNGVEQQEDFEDAQDSKHEIPTPDVARAHPHLKDIANAILEIQDDVGILLLVGRDAPPLQKIHEPRNGSSNAPWAQRLDLGWAIMGNAYLDGAHKPEVSSYKTHFTNGPPLILEPCPNRFHINGNVPNLPNVEVLRCKESFVNGKFDDGLGTKVFVSSKDNKPGHSVEDRKFLSIMNDQMIKKKQRN